jgi:hypothetical protein
MTMKTVEINLEYCDHIFCVINQVFMCICENLRIYGDWTKFGIMSKLYLWPLLNMWSFEVSNTISNHTVEVTLLLVGLIS